MKKVIFSISLLIYLSINIFNCNSDDEVSIIPVEEYNPKVSIDLISPIDSIVSFDNVILKWDANNNFPIGLKVAKNQSFEQWVTDILVPNNIYEYELPNYLAPKSQYYWKIFTDSVEAVGKFETEDIISQYTGSYDVMVDHSHNDDDYEIFNFDTTYNSVLDLSIEGDKIHLNIPGVMNNSLDFWGDHPEVSSNNLTYRKIIVYWRNELYMNIKTDVDSIFILRYDGGPSDQTSWNIKASLE